LLAIARMSEAQAGRESAPRRYQTMTKVMESQNRVSALSYNNSLRYADTPVIA
jgi:hypothetical protein